MKKDDDGKLWCYVNQPTSCTDASKSRSLPGEMHSAEPCKKGMIVLQKNGKLIHIIIYLYDNDIYLLSFMLERGRRILSVLNDHE